LSDQRRDLRTGCNDAKTQAWERKSGSLGSRVRGDGNDVPHVVVKLWPGKSEEQKIELAEEITRDVMSILDYGEESVSVAIEEVKPQDWAEKVYRPEVVGKWDTLYKQPGYTM
jgi:4-oxalocrotonate tautomerase